MARLPGSVLAFLDSAPSYSVTQPVTVNSTGCKKTRLRVQAPFAPKAGRVRVRAELDCRHLGQADRGTPAFEALCRRVGSMLFGVTEVADA